MHDRISLDAEITPTIAAEEGHRLPVLSLVDGIAVAPRATNPVRPTLFDEPSLGSRLIAEVSYRVDKADAFPVCLAGSQTHKSASSCKLYLGLIIHKQAFVWQGFLREYV